VDAYAYPEQLAAFVAGVWPETADPLPPPRVLRHILSTAYQASLLRDEARPVTFRLLVVPRERIDANGGPPESLHPLSLDPPRPFAPHELRRLSPAAPYASALVGVDARERPSGRSGGAEVELAMWGVLRSGTRWQEQVGAESARLGVPPGSLVVLVQGPGRVAVGCGEITIADIRGGIISGEAFDVFESRWLRDHFAGIRAELVEAYKAECACDPSLPALIEPETLRAVSQGMVRRALAAIREARHGGTILWVPLDASAYGKHLVVKYPLADDPARRRYRALMLRRMRWLAGERRDPGELAAIDDGIAEMSNLLASLTAVDGAAVLSWRFELLGFGGEITNVPASSTVATALDLEARDRAVESVDEVGTRHRTAYRFCAAVPDALAIVVSQDGGVQFVANLGGEVVRWHHTAMGSIEV
jgi:hypothetical protein